MTVHPRRLQVLDVIRKRMALDGTMPTYKEIADELQWENYHSASDAISALVRLGYLRRIHRSRGGSSRYTFELV